MRIQVSFKPTIVIALLFATIALNGFSLLFLTSLDRVVNVDLYKYRLQYNEAWAIVYQQYLYLTIIPLMVSMLTAGLSIMCVLIYRRTRKTEVRLLCYAFLCTSAVATGLSIFSFMRLDRLVHGDLYQYGLVFNYEWATRYWQYSNLTLGLNELAVAVIAVSGTLVFLSARANFKITKTRALCYTFSFIGTIALVLSINYNSQILALIGLGLTFWGLLFGYVAGENYVRKSVSQAIALSPLIMLNEMLTELNYNGKAVYLPPVYLRNPEDNRAYVAKGTGTKLPSPEQIPESNIFIKEPEGLLIIPPGDELTKLFERHIGTSFAKVDLSYLERNLSKLLTEDFEIAEDFKIKIENGVAFATIENSVYEIVFKETMKLAKTISLGCPVSSALACMLAKASGKPVVVRKNQISQDGKVIAIEYGLLEDPQRRYWE